MRTTKVIAFSVPREFESTHEKVAKRLQKKGLKSSAVEEEIEKSRKRT